MSKIGQKHIPVTSAVTATIKHQDVHVKGAKGEMSFTLPHTLKVKLHDGVIMVERTQDTKEVKSLHGLWRSLLANAVHGVEHGWSRRLEVVGTGFNVKMQGQSLVLKVGYSHPVAVQPVPGITFAIEGNNIIIISGYDKQKVGEVAFQIKTIRMPDAYKGKGIRFEGEKIRIKPGKKAKTA